MKIVNCSKPGYTSITCSKIENIPYNIIFTTKFNDASILITIKENSYNFRYQNTVDVPRPRTTRYDKESFSYEAATLWNS